MAVLRRHGGDFVWIERANGELRIVPLSWTDLVPRREALIHEGRPVFLAPETALALAAWVRSRRKSD